MKERKHDSEIKKQKKKKQKETQKYGKRKGKCNKESEKEGEVEVQKSRNINKKERCDILQISSSTREGRDSGETVTMAIEVFITMDII